METVFNYPISINGQVKTNIAFDVAEDRPTIEAVVYNKMEQYFEGKEPKAFIFRRNRMINIVI